MSRIRVVFSIGAMHGGGSERQLVSLLRNLDRDRFEPFLYLVYRSGPLLELIPDDVPVASFDERVSSSGLYLPGLMHRRRVSDLAQYFKEVRADVSYDRTFLMTLISAAAAQRVGIPNVSTIVTDPETGFAPVAGRFQWFKRRILHRLYNKSSRVLAVSDGARESAIRFYGIRPEKIQTLTNGVDVELLREQALIPPSDSWWGGGNQSFTDDTAVVRLVTAGRLNEQKGFHYLIHALAALKKQHPDRRFYLAILGEGSWRSRLQDLIHSLELTENVRLPGFCKNAAAWYSSANVFVLPSLIEGMPNVLLEAMALGVPVISADCPSGPRQILAGGQLGILVPPGSSAALASAISEVIRKTEDTKLRADKARQAIEQHYSIAAACRQLQGILIKVTDRH